MAFAKLGDAPHAWELLDMINPVNHARSAADLARYKVEPYVMTADVYAAPPHLGRGGWSWYTGSAGWMYRLIVESLLGLRREGERLRIAPVLPAGWPGFELDYQHGSTLYRIRVLHGVPALAVPNGAISVLLDGMAQDEPIILLMDDLQKHDVEVRVPEKG